eukprot:gene25179-biopygen9000
MRRRRRRTRGNNKRMRRRGRRQEGNDVFCGAAGAGEGEKCGGTAEKVESLRRGCTEKGERAQNAGNMAPQAPNAAETCKGWTKWKTAPKAPGNFDHQVPGT